PRGGRSALWWAANELVAALEGRSTLTVQQCITGVKRLLAEADLRTPRGEGEAAAMSANLARALAAMQAAWIEWRRGRGADAAMQWIENTLIGPGLIPGDNESDAQAFFDRAIAEIENHQIRDAAALRSDADALELIRWAESRHAALEPVAGNVMPPGTYACY